MKCNIKNGYLRAQIGVTNLPQISIKSYFHFNVQVGASDPATC